jgi:hypothetical protein
VIEGEQLDVFHSGEHSPLDGHGAVALAANDFVEVGEVTIELAAEEADVAAACSGLLQREPNPVERRLG